MAELMFSLLLFAAGGIVWSLRDNTNPAALWTWGWVVAAAAALFLAYCPPGLPMADASTLLTSALLPAFLFVGARAYADRPAPRWVLPAVLLVGGARWALSQGGAPGLSHAVGVAGEPALVLAAVVWVSGAARSSDATMAQRLLVPALACMALLEGATSWAVWQDDVIPSSLVTTWYVAGLATFGLQITAAGHRSRTQRRRLQAESERTRLALRESEERYAVLAENASDLISELDAAGRLLYLSPSVEEILGRRPEEMVGRMSAEFVHPDDRAATDRQLETVSETGSARAVFRCRHVNGDWRWLESHTRSFLSASGDRRIVSVSRDVTAREKDHAELLESHDTLERRVEDRTAQLRTAIRELEREVEARRKAEAELRASRERYRVVSEISSDFSFCFRLDPSGQLDIEWVTDAFTRVTGWSISELEGRGWLELFEPRHRDRLPEPIHQIFVEGTLDFEGQIRTRSGEPRWLSSRVTSTRLEGAGGVRVVGASRDVTDRHNARRERRQLEAHLNEVQRLESLGVLAGGIAHDFNNLLSVILGNTSLLLGDAEASSDLGRRLGRIRSAAQHAARLTEQMLTYSGKAAFSLKPIDLAQVVEATRDLLEASISRRSSLYVEVTPGQAVMDGDETQLRQVVLNLVSNAAEALAERSGTVRIRTGISPVSAADLAHCVGDPDAQPGEYVHLEVIDTGSGIDPAARERIFDPFFSTRQSGRGLGLATVIGIVRGHRGVIQLESDPGKGTTFRVLFPRSSWEPSDSPTTFAPAASDPIAARVLVIDDEEDVLELAGEFLRRAGLDVVTAQGGREGLARVEEYGETIDLVVLDLVMPDLDGEETFKRIRMRLPDVPVLLTSGYDEERTVDRFTSERGLAFLGKPYEPEALIEKVRAAIARAHA